MVSPAITAAEFRRYFDKLGREAPLKPSTDVESDSDPDEG